MRSKAERERQRRCLEIIPQNSNSVHIGTSFQGNCVAVKQEKTIQQKHKGGKRGLIGANLSHTPHLPLPHLPY